MVIIIEDEPIYQKLVASALRDTGWKIDIAGDGFSAIEKFNPNIHELAIVDLVLPGPLSGLELIKKLLHLKPNIKILVCSGYGNQTILHKLEKTGARHYLNKPFTPDQMLRKVKQIMGESIPEPTTETNVPETGPKDPSTIPDMFLNFNKATIHDLCERGVMQSLQKHTHIAYNHTESILIVMDGSIRCTCRQDILGILGPGTSLGYESLTHDIDPECELTLEALQESTICIIPKIDFLKYFCESSDDLLAQLQQNVKNIIPENPIYKRMQQSSQQNNLSTPRFNFPDEIN